LVRLLAEPRTPRSVDSMTTVFGCALAVLFVTNRPVIALRARVPPAPARDWPFGGFDERAR
jgi:hypothetical protein